MIRPDTNCLIIQIIIPRGSLHLLKFSYRDALALGIGSSIKNINLAVLIAASQKKGQTT